MSNIDLELELLGLDDGVQIFGEHELKTSPLVSRDALDLSIASQAGGHDDGEQFVQRGLLGKILSVHSEDLQPKPKDVRLYMNLDAPSSGLVCGVQGSGKSHTVSCILESSLMVNPRIGTLPAPLSTIVFHYDEENGGRPCEAAYLSELKDNAGQGVKEVVVLVSPSNFNTRKKVYSNLKYVRVEALRISEKDLNASRMLCMMGADNLEQVPLYLHTALSILRDMGSDNFTYRAFRKRLDEEEFNKSQLAMLQLRLDLLDSFLKGNGEDITYFFKPGRLVIIDLSDPFVNSTTAAMLFDICLGLFVEWKVSTGKLIVLDEAHKYLTNADANQFTKKICSIIRQQRHLAARVIVSTQEPTVVPSSVLDLLAWIVCHRFSSPSWVKHLMHHMCVDEEEGSSSGKGRGDKGSDWSKRVMALRTGEALLCSPASLFVSDSGNLATLSTGYAVIKTRPRLTRDGGASLLATVDLTEARYKNGMPTPESERLSLTSSASPTPSDHSISTSSRGQGNLTGNVIPGNSVETGLRPTNMLSPMISTMPMQQATGTNQIRQPNNSLPVHQPVKLGQETSSTFMTVPKSPAPSPTPLSQIEKDPEQSNSSAPTSKPTPEATPISSALPPTALAIQQYKTLIDVMNFLATPSSNFVGLNDIGSKSISRWGAFWSTSGKLLKYLRAAAETNVITLRGSGDGTIASLHPSLRTSPASQSQEDASKAPSQPPPHQPHDKFQPLVTVLRNLTTGSANFILLSKLGEGLVRQAPGCYKAAGFTRLKPFIEAAQKLGLLELRGTGGYEEVRLVV